ncbi:MAG: tyrosinase family protein [Vicinamibacterales bacterium]
MRYRKNVNCLTTDELHDLREALAAMYALPAADPFSFATLASFHGGPPTAFCAHGAPGFFTWHRAYLLAFEDALRRVGCHVTLPYWDWSSGPSTGVPAACRQSTYVNRAGATVANPLYSGPRAAGGQTARRADIDTTAYDDLATSAQAALGAATFTSFQSQVNGVHGGVHVRTGGDMGNVPTAAYDPIFFLHHANVDRLWASWQAAHPGPLPAGEAAFLLQPFPRPHSVSWQTGADVVSVDALGYRYLRFCFKFPPFRVWEVVRFEWPLPLRRQVDAVRVVLKSHHMQPAPVEIRAFVNQPEATAATRTAGNPGFAGTVAFFGHGEPDPHGLKAGASAGHQGHGMARPAPQPGVKERFDLELDITRALSAMPDDAKEASLKLVAIDGAGNHVGADDLILEEIAIEVD